MAVRLKDIAKRVGVTPTTVSRVLRGAEGPIGASEATRRKVLAAAKDLGFRPNAAARMMRRGSFQRVACVAVGYGTKAIPTGIATGYFNTAAGELVKQGYLSIFEEILLDPATNEIIEQPHLFRESSIDGIFAISMADTIPAKIDEQFNALGVPVVWVNREPVPGIVCVNSDEISNGRMLARYLIELGHRHIGYIGPYKGRQESHYSAFDRPEGIRQELQIAGLDTAGVLVHPHRDWHKPEPRIREIERVLGMSPRPTAVICNYLEVYDWTLLVAQRRSLLVPADLSLCCFASVGEMQTRSPVTALVLAEIEMARRGAELLVAMLAGQNAEESVPPFAGWLHVGMSTAAPDAPDALAALPPNFEVRRPTATSGGAFR